MVSTEVLVMSRVGKQLGVLEVIPNWSKKHAKLRIPTALIQIFYPVSLFIALSIVAAVIPMKGGKKKKRK
jgi:hypothetical protein